MSLDQPNPPDPGLLTGTQQAVNFSAAEDQRKLNEQNFASPFGGVNYTNGAVTSWLSPQVQSLVDQYQKTQGNVGGAANDLASTFAGLYGKPADFLAQSSPLVQRQMDAFNQYMQPTYKNQKSNLDSALASQGITQGSDAWNNAQRGYYTSQDQATQSALMNFEPTAFNQAVQSYQLPMQTLAGLLGLTQPGAAAQGTQQPFSPQYSPQETTQPANYMGAAQQNFQQQQNQFQNTMSGIGGIGSSIAGMFGLGNGGLGKAVGGLFGL